MLRRLGAGGFARVYLAMDPDLDLEIAVKILRPDLADDPDTVERFRREASMAARLRHPHIITVLSVGRLEEPFDGIPPGAPYLVMDYLPVSLAERLAHDGTLAETEVERIGAEVARGLAYAHRQGLVHRDVKPENVLFARDGRAVVTDFGIARAVSGPSAATSRQLLLGTPSYFSPEQARGLPLDGRSDLYGLGVTLFRAATGALPFSGDDWYEVMRQHIERPVPSAREVVPSLSESLDAVLARAMAKDPDARFPNGDQMALALDRARGVGADGGDLTVAVPALPPRRRRWPVVTLAAALAAAAGGLLLARHDPPSTIAARTAPDSSARSMAPQTADSLAPAPGDSAATGTPAGAFAPPVDSTPRIVPVRPTTASLTVSAPDDAELWVDGRVVGRGAWHGAALTPGRHDVRAAIATLPGCADADTTTIVELAAGARRTIQLAPVRCGSLTLNFTPTPAHYTLTSARGGTVRQGWLPLAQPIVLPEGDYRLRVEARSCVAYNDDVPVVADRTRTEQHPLICN